MKMTKKTKRTIRRIKSFIAVILAVVALFMAIYSIAIAIESKVYTRNIHQARFDARGFHPSTRQEYEDEIYLEESAKRDALYERNTYTQWFFGLSSTLNRFFVILGWLAIPTLIIGMAMLKIWVEYVITINNPPVRRRCY